MLSPGYRPALHPRTDQNCPLARAAIQSLTEREEAGRGTLDAVRQRMSLCASHRHQCPIAGPTSPPVRVKPWLTGARPICDRIGQHAVEESETTAEVERRSLPPAARPRRAAVIGADGQSSLRDRRTRNKRTSAFALLV